MFWLIDSCQNSVSADQYRLTASRAVSAVKLILFKWSQAQVQFVLKCIWNKSCSWAALLKCWFRTDFGRENSTGFYIYMQGRLSLLTFLTVARWSRSTSNSYVLIGQNLTGEFMQKIYAASGNLLTDSWSWQSFVREFCLILWCFKLSFSTWLVYKMKYSCYQDCSVIHGWFVYCAFCSQMHRSSKSLEIRFRMASFSKTSLLTCPCLRRKTVENSGTLDDLQKQHLDW